MSDYRNVFGDTGLIQNALILKARILSKDNAVKRMVKFFAIPEIIVTDQVATGVFRRIWFSVMKWMESVLHGKISKVRNRVSTA
jgi:hypothetical protein